MSRNVAAALLALGALALAVVVLRAPADIDGRAKGAVRDGQLDAWVARTAPAAWGAALLAALAGSLVAAPAVPAITTHTGRRLAVPLAAAVTVYAAYVATARLDRIPHVWDEFNYLFQAKNLALGRMGAPVPDHLPHFDQLFFVVHGGHWYGSSLPGHPLVLALGVLAGAAWLVNPTAAGLTLLLAHRLLERVLSPGAALAGAGLLAASPFFHLLSATYLAHGTTLLCATAMLHFGLRFVDDGRTADGALASAAFGLGFLARPQAILTWALPLAAWGLHRFLRHRSPLRARPLPGAVALVLPLLPLAAFHLAYNETLTGEWLNTPRSIVSPSHTLGFGDDVGMPMKDDTYSGHTPAQGIANVRLLLALLSRDLFGWWGFSLLLLPFSLAAVRRVPLAGIAWVALLLDAAVYFAYFNPSPLYGPRYFFELLPGLVLLTVLGGDAISRLARRQDVVHRGLAAGLGLLTLLALLTFRPAHLDRYQPPKATALRRALAELPAGPSLVFLPPGHFATRGQSFNDPDLKAERLLAADRGERANRTLMASMPGRAFYRFRYDRATDHGTIRPYDEERLKVLLVGIDAATWKVARPMMERGELPVLAKLVAAGAHGELATLTPTLSPSIWTTIATGLPPEEHGITGFVEGDRPEALQVTSDRRKAPALWDMAAQSELSSIVVSYWCTWPAEPIRGVLVSDRATDPTLDHRVHPPSILPKVQELLGVDQGRTHGGMKAGQHAGVDEDRLLELARHLMDREPARLAIVYFRELDIVQHEAWKFLEPDGFDVPEAEMKAKGRQIPDAYRRYDRYLGELLEQIGPDGNVVLVSDHGMESAARMPPAVVFQVNQLLERMGLLAFQRRPIVDRGHSRAVSGTFPLGEDVPVEVLDAPSQNEVREKLAAVTVGGKPLFTVADESPGRLRLRIADRSRDGALAWPGGSARLEDFVREKPRPVSGQHEDAPPGMIVMAGPEVRPGVPITGASVHDVAPTVLALLGLPQAEGSSGRLLAEALTDRAQAAAAATGTRRYTRPPPITGAALSEAAREATLEDLRGLGYIQ